MEAIASAKGWAPSGSGGEKFTGYEFSSGKTETAGDFASVGHVESQPMTSVVGNGNGGYWKQLVQHWHATVTYCAVFWTFGLCVAFLGPTLLDLGCLTSSDMRHISWVFLAQLFCSLVGATVAGYLARKLVFSTLQCNQEQGVPGAGGTAPQMLSNPRTRPLHSLKIPTMGQSP